MFSLTLLPRQSDAKVGPAYPIAGQTAASSARQDGRRSSGISLNFAARGPFKESTIDDTLRSSPSKQTSSDARLKVRLAHDDLLVPFLNRPEEVHELLFETEKNKDLAQTLQTLFSHTPDEWLKLTTLLSKTERDELGDRQWLGQLYSLLFPRSATIWCRLVDCLGAYGIDWTSLNQDSTPEQDEDVAESFGFADVFSDGSSSSFATDRTFRASGLEYEALCEVPRTFRGPPTTVDRPSYRLDEQIQANEQNTTTRHRRSSSMLSTGENEEVDEFLASNKFGFAGIRMSWSGSEDWDNPSHTRSASVPYFQERQRTDDRSGQARGGSCRQLHHFARHRRLSSLFMTRSVEEGARKEKTDAWEKPLETKQVRASPVQRWQPSPAKETRKEETSPVSQSAPAFARSFSTRQASEGEECTRGLLPDGRTRHPSAGNGPASKEAAALLAFKNELKLSGYGKDAQRGGSLNSPPLSDDSFPTTVSPTGTSSPETLKKRVQWEPSPHSSRTHLIFPIPPGPQFSRSKQLIERLDSPENKPALAGIKDVIGTPAYAQLRSIVQGHERSQMADQPLLEWIAKDCFTLVDQDKEMRDTVDAYLLDEQYEARWKAFAQLCDVWNIDDAVIRHAKRRCGPAVKLF